MAHFESPIPVSDIESVLAWVDTFKLSRTTKKINRDFSDAVLLAEILSVNYPKLVEMHNYPPRNSHSLKLNNWMTLNRKVLKKLKITLCSNTMEQLANCAPGVIERVLVLVRDKIRRDEEANRNTKDAEQNVSSGGSYYEACGDDENVLMIPIKTRVNGVLETIQQKVINYKSYVALKEELKDAKDTSDLLKQKVEHLDNLLKLKEERIEELQKQLERKQTRRKESEAIQNSLAVPFESSPPSPHIDDILSNHANKHLKPTEYSTKAAKTEESKIPVPVDSIRFQSKSSIVADTDFASADVKDNVDSAKSDVFKEIDIVQDITDFSGGELKDSKREIIKAIDKPMELMRDNVRHLDKLINQNEKGKGETQIDKEESNGEDNRKAEYNIAIPCEYLPPNAVNTHKVNSQPNKKVKASQSNTKSTIPDESKIPVPIVSIRTISNPSVTDVTSKICTDNITSDDVDKLDTVKSDVFKEIEIVEEKSESQDSEEFKDSEQGITTLADCIHSEVRDIDSVQENLFYL